MTACRACGRGQCNLDFFPENHCLSRSGLGAAPNRRPYQSEHRRSPARWAVDMASWRWRRLEWWWRRWRRHRRWQHTPERGHSPLAGAPSSGRAAGMPARARALAQGLRGSPARTKGLKSRNATRPCSGARAKAACRRRARKSPNAKRPCRCARADACRPRSLRSPECEHGEVYRKGKGCVPPDHGPETASCDRPFIKVGNGCACPPGLIQHGHDCRPPTVVVVPPPVVVPVGPGPEGPPQMVPAATPPAPPPPPRRGLAGPAEEPSTHPVAGENRAGRKPLPAG